MSAPLPPSEASIPVGFRLSDYDYELPQERIAAFPLAQRDQSKMLVVDRATGSFTHAHFYELPHYLAPNDLLVLNNTQVLPCRVLGHRLDVTTGQPHTGKVELFFLHPTDETDLQWEVLCKPARKLPVGTVVQVPGNATTLRVVAQRPQGKAVVVVENLTHASVVAWLHAVGHMPIPPYLGRAATEADTETYQTVFAKPHAALGQSQAAPTAGLHMTPEVLAQLAQRGIATTECTLTVSTGTFREVTSDHIADHRMDAEHYDLPETAVAAIQQARLQGGRVIAMGTTPTKTLETVANLNNGQVVAQQGWSELFITPGFEFNVVDGLLTNFHLPKSTLLMLVSAFANRDLMLAAYEEAIRHEYRFYSYGDCMLIL